VRALMFEAFVQSGLLAAVHPNRTRHVA